MTETVDRSLVRLTGDEANALPHVIRDEVYDWARSNGLNVPDDERPITCVTLDPEGEETYMYVTELEMDESSDYDSHIRRVVVAKPLPAHLISYFTPIGTGSARRYQVPDGGLAGSLPDGLLQRLLP